MKDLRRFFGYLARRPLRYAAGFASQAGSTAFFLTMPRIVGHAIEGLSTGVSGGKLARAAGIILLLAVGDAICLFLTRRILIGLSRDIEYEMRQDFFAHLLRLPTSWYRKNRVGDVMSRAVNDLSAVRMLLGPGIMQGTNTVFVGITAIVLMLTVSPLLTAMCLAIFPVVAVVTSVIGQATHRRFTAIQEFFSEISNGAQENFSGIRLVRAFAKETTEEARFAAKNREFLARNLALARLNALYFPLLQLLVGVGFALTLFVGGKLILSRELTVARYVEFNLYMMEIIWPAIALGWVVNLFQRGSASWNRMLLVWTAEPLPEEKDDGTRFRGDLRIEGLTWGHEGRPVLNGVTLSVAAGQTVAVVGRTGAGKSTLLSLLLRLDDPPKGTVFLDGRDVDDIPLPTLRRNVVPVPQETFLFSDTLAANIAFARPDATREEIESAALSAGLGPDLALLPKGLDTVVGERGITLSGGQKQRTALARALLSGAPVLLLDDAFSSVDTQTEAAILAGLRDAALGRTVFVVSHRLSTVKDSDLIVVLDKGAIAESGTHEELLEKGGLYAALAERQRLIEEVEAA